MSNSPPSDQAGGQRRVDEQAPDPHRAFLEKAQQVAKIGSWVAEYEGSGAVDWSIETYRIFGVARGEFQGTAEAFYAFVHPDDLEAVRRAGRASREDGQPYEIEHRIVRADGEVRWVHSRADVVRDASGTPVRMVGTVQDITERRQLEERSRQSQKLEAIGRLAGGVAHDLNNALTAIVGYTELALSGLEDSHPARPDVQEIRRAAERAASVTRQLLAFSRKQLLQPRVFYLNDSIENLGRLLARLLGENIELTTAASGPLAVYGDPGQIEQAMLNLAVNARDAMPDGGRLTLAVSTADVDASFARAHQPMPPGHYVELSITDTGEGMDPETQAHIFEPFFTTKDVGKGTGLGLAMVYGTVKQSGGFIFVDSAPGQGTTFRLYFPEAAPAELKPPPPAAIEPAARPTVLVAEDEPAVRNLVVATLQKQGYRVLHAASGTEALDLAGTELDGLGLLITDANMPGMSGIDLAAALMKRRTDLKVIVMSGYTEGTEHLPGPAGRVSLLPKPFTPKDLRQKVSGVLAGD